MSKKNEMNRRFAVFLFTILAVVSIMFIAIGYEIILSIIKAAAALSDELRLLFVLICAFIFCWIIILAAIKLFQNALTGIFKYIFGDEK